MHSSTHQIKTFKTLTDSIFINTLEFGSNWGNVTSQIWDHLLQFVIIKDLLRKSPSNQSDSFERNYNFFNDDEFKNGLKNIFWQDILSQNNISASMAFNFFFEQVSAFFDKHALLHKLSKKKNILKQNHGFIREFNFQWKNVTNY